MRVPMSWLRELLPGLTASADEVAAAMTRIGHNVEQVEALGREISGVIVGEVLDIEELTEFKKPIRFCQVRVAPEGEPRGIVCGARNFAVGDRVAVALPGAVLPGGFEITARKTYGRVSDGMICSARELGTGDDHEGILVLPPDTPLGSDVSELLGDDVLVVDVTPDRGYCMSMRGLAREVATAYELPFDDPADLAVAPVAGESLSIAIEDPSGCDRYVARELRGVDPGTRLPLSVERRLPLSGMRSISAVVDATNLVMLGLGQPLHAFDLAAIRGGIVVRRARAGEHLVTLDGVDRALDPDDLVIADDSGPIALAGVMGGASTEIGPDTKDVLLEAAHFDPAVVGRMARRHRLPSEASRRFERGVDPALAPQAAEAVARLLGVPGETRVTDVDLRQPPAPIAFEEDLPGRIAGVPYRPEVVRRRLEDIGCEVTGAGSLQVRPPSWRLDLTGEADLVEEVVRLEGYEKIPSVLPPVPAGRGLTEDQRRRRAASRALAYAGYVEVSTPPFVAGDIAERLGIAEGDPRRAAVRISNPLSEEEAFLRTTLLPGLLAALVRNVSRGASDVALSETGLVFRASGAPSVPSPTGPGRPSDETLALLNAALPAQPLHSAMVLAGHFQPAGWWGPGRAADWADAVQAVQVLADSVATPIEVQQATDAAPWHPGRCAAVLAGGRVIGHAGELHPRVVSAFDLPARTCAAEIDLGVLLAAGSREEITPSVSPYPPADRDVALTVESRVPVATVEAALREGAGPLLESLRLFDVYDLGEGQRSLAFRLILRAPDRTLTAEEANAVRDAAVSVAVERTGARQRGA
jgi:phenylalanyl-tRNA synthetase beta chain